MSSAESGGVVGGGESLLLSEFDRSYAVPLGMCKFMIESNT